MQSLVRKKARSCHRDEMLKLPLCLIFCKCPYFMRSLFINSLRQEQDNMLPIPSKYGLRQRTYQLSGEASSWQSQIYVGFSKSFQDNANSLSVTCERVQISENKRVVFSKAGNIKSRAVVFCWSQCFKAVFKGSIMENKLQQFNLDVRKALLTVGRAMPLEEEERFAIAL